MDILFVTPAIAPYHPSGELSDVNRALAKALRGLGHRVTVLSPLYAGIDPGQHALGRRLSTLDVDVAGKTRECIVFTGRTTGGVELVFISHDETFDAASASGDGPAQRTAGVVLCHAAARWAAQASPRPEVVHGFGFQGALAGPLCRARGLEVATVFTPGEDGLTGAADADEQRGWNLPDALASSVAAAGSLRGTGLSLCRSVVSSEAALQALDTGADAPGAVSIPHAVDASVWNPLTDAALEARFDPSSLEGKDRCKGALQYAADLPIRPETPLLGILGDGSDALLAGVAEGLLRNDVQIAVAIEGEDAPATLNELLEKHEDRVKTVDVGTTEGLHEFVAGCDLLLLTPEACAGGTLHLCAQRYGTPPIVAAGSLAAEQVVDADAHLKTGSGFVYVGTEGLGGALGRALSAHASTTAFGALRARLMRIDTSWDRVARRYEHTYRKALPEPAPEQAAAS